MFGVIVDRCIIHILFHVVQCRRGYSQKVATSIKGLGLEHKRKRENEPRPFVSHADSRDGKGRAVVSYLTFNHHCCPQPPNDAPKLQ